MTAVDEPAIADAELYDPVTGSWTPTIPLPEPRERAAAISLADGSILLVGGLRAAAGVGDLYGTFIEADSLGYT